MHYFVDKDRFHQRAKYGTVPILYSRELEPERFQGQDFIPHEATPIYDCTILYAQTKLTVWMRTGCTHVQTIFGKINVIMTLTFLSFFLLTITPICCNYANIYSTDHFITELTLFPMLESAKDTSLHRPDDVAMSHNKQLIDTVRGRV